MNRNATAQSIQLLPSDTGLTRGRCAEHDPCIASSTMGLWDLTFLAPGRDKFQLSRQFLIGKGFALYTDTYCAKTQVIGSTQPDTFTLVIPLNERPGSEGFGHALCAERVLAGFHSCVDVHFGKDQRILVVMLDTRLIQQASTGQALQQLEKTCRSRWITPEPAALTSTTESLMSLLSDSSTSTAPESLAHAIACAVIDMTSTCLPYEQEINTPSLRRLGYERALAIIERCTDLPVSIPQLCSEAGVSQRTLEYAFREYTGMTPKRYLLYARYWQLRRKLLTDPSCRSVHDAATRLGITELGRMAAQYRLWFGELPSESLTGRALPDRFTP